MFVAVPFDEAGWQPHDSPTLGWCLEVTAASESCAESPTLLGLARPITTSLSTTPIVPQQQLHTYPHTIPPPSIVL